MERVYEDITELIGKTPLVRLFRYCRKHKINADILAKLEYLNPAGSAKDRIALTMIQDAEKSGELQPGATIIEPTSGNTGIGLCSVAAAKGYKTIIVMPETMSVERQKLMRAYGAELVLTEGTLGMQGAVERAKELARTIQNSFIPGQFENPANPQAHWAATGPEIWEDTQGKIDIFIAGIGTGGTITGTGAYLKSQNSKIQVIGVEPASSPLLTEGYAGSHKLQGIGANFIPEILNREVMDEVITVTDAAAYDTVREIAKTEGFLVGISSGAALSAAAEIARRPENRGKTFVVFMTDGGERYLSAGVFE